MLPRPTTAEAQKISNQPNYGQKGLSNHPAIVGETAREKLAKSRSGQAGPANQHDWEEPRTVANTKGG